MPELTVQGKVQLLRSMEDSLARIDRRLQKLQMDLEAIQWEVTDLRNIKAAIEGAVELMKDGLLK